MSASLSVGRIVPGEAELVSIPRLGGGAGLPLMLLAHGSGGVAADWRSGLTQVGATRIGAVLGRRYACIGADWGGTQTFAADVVKDRFDQYIEWARDNLPGVRVDEVFIFGGSMGNATGLRCALERRSQVAAVGGVIPLCDPQGIRAADLWGAKAVIEDAWDLAPDAPIPARGDLLARAQAGELDGLPWAGWYSSGDTLTTPDAVLAMAEAIGSTAESYDVSDADHSDTAVRAVDPDDVLGFFRSHE